MKGGLTMMNSETSQSIAQGGAAAVAIAFLQQTVTRMIPYSLPALALIILDLIYGIKAARVRGDRIRFSTGLKKTTTKIFCYICWIILASTMSQSFGKDWIEWAVLAVVFVNELASVVGNYLETKGITLSFVAFYRWIFKKAGEKAGVEISEEEAKEIIKDKEAKGSLVKKCGIEIDEEQITPEE